MAQSKQSKVTIEMVDDEMKSVKAKIGKNYPEVDLTLIDKAYAFAKSAHGDQRRRSGEPYIMHPVAIADILADLHMDPPTIIAALLHDVIEDTGHTKEEVAEEFGEEIANMVESVTKMTQLRYQSRERSQNEYLRKMIVAMSKDIRIIIIKLVDRLHNMRTLEYMTSAKQKEKASETIEIYAPLADRLGIQQIKSELEDLSFKYLNPEAYKTIRNNLRLKQAQADKYISSMKAKVNELLEEEGIQAEVTGRVKHIYSIYKKMKNSNLELDDVTDVYAIRIIVDNITDCYATLGIINQAFIAIPDRFKDYISRPKANGYQSLHTTVFTGKNRLCEIQIRTKAMHRENEYGVASHWRYKELQDADDVKAFKKGVSWVDQLMEWSEDFQNAGEFVETMKVDILCDEIFVYTPNGDIIELPKGSTPIDFAYRIHTNIGNHCYGCLINGEMCALNTPLDSGDIVTILINKSAKGPTANWLNWANSSHARHKIKQFLNNQNRVANIRAGKELFATLVKERYPEDSKVFLENKSLVKIRKHLDYKSLDDFYVAVALKSIKPKDLWATIEKLFPQKVEEEKKELIISKPSKQSHWDVLVEGKEGIDVHYAKCCKPVPGEDIIGFITQTRGISVHRQDCAHVKNFLKDKKKRQKLIDVEWNETIKDSSFSVELKVSTASKKGGLMDVVRPLYESNVPIIKTSSITSNGIDYYDIFCEVKDIEQLKHLHKEISKIPEVISVKRA